MSYDSNLLRRAAARLEENRLRREQEQEAEASAGDYTDEELEQAARALAESEGSAPAADGI